MTCEDRECQKKLNENHQWIFGVEGKGSAASCLERLKLEVSKKVSVRAVLILLTLGVAPTMAVTAWAWHISSNHETRICIVESQQAQVAETLRTTKEILEILEKYR